MSHSKTTAAPCPPPEFSESPETSQVSETPEAPDGEDPDPEPSGVELSFTLDTLDTDPPAAGWIESRLAEALRLTGVTSGSLSVTLIDDATMSRLHGEHCGDPTTTDVLTFDLSDTRGTSEAGSPLTQIDGDLVICRDEAQRQADERGHDARAELLLYAVHGLMHLLGEDDHDEASYQHMHRREDELLTRLGLGPLFAPPAPGSAPVPGSAHAPGSTPLGNPSGEGASSC